MNIVDRRSETSYWPNMWPENQYSEKYGIDRCSCTHTHATIIIITTTTTTTTTNEGPFGVKLCSVCQI